MAHFMQRTRMAAPVYPYKRECGLVQYSRAVPFAEKRINETWPDGLRSTRLYPNEL